ncbi:alpha/beta fold hydrolase [Actinopolymorpha pittospori]|uniref:Pimeloyl-ACP methyl ester carboxylesterase n=1 Tax=Actinopolymorpha pittospori TaxID=648752 RepID=A0A927MPQ5_9ACTN|nr:alpha/beta hydrolase [Actinopolymorpha pittospori]MBE1603824.1 pimeloyl-ACP methyl ester carboxylesterase [Actinopolymorpha pittospori]
MDKVTSADGTPIAYDWLGRGRPVIVVGGATCDRAVTRRTAEALAEYSGVLNYDRRGRGDSGDTAPYAVEREVEDLAALIAAAGGTASVYSHSSGAGLALHAAGQGLAIDRLVLHEAPYTPDAEEARRAARTYGEELRRILADGRRGDAVALFLSITGVPDEVIVGMRAEPYWVGMEARAHTLAYDSEVMGDISQGGTLPAEVAAAVCVPTLVISGGASPDWMIATGQRLADIIPDGRHRVLDGQGHVVPAEVLASVLEEFFTA